MGANLSAKLFLAWGAWKSFFSCGFCIFKMGGRDVPSTPDPSSLPPDVMYRLYSAIAK